MAGRSNDDAVSEFGDDNMFVGAPAVRASNDNVGQQQSSKSQTHSSSLPTKGLMREDPRVSTGWGRGPIPVDPRKIRFDVTRARQSPALSFSATKVDRMDPSLAGDYLERLLKMYGIDREEENRILAFTNALWFEHTVNGASMLQPGRGFLYVDGVSFDIQPIKVMLGVDMRRFFRAFADEIASANQDVIDAYDAYVPELAEKHGQLMQVATERGLHKYPHLAHDSSDACLTLSHEERLAVINSKRVVLPSVVNKVDVIPGRVGSNKGTATEQQVPAGAAGMNN